MQLHNKIQNIIDESGLSQSDFVKLASINFIVSFADSEGGTISRDAILSGIKTIKRLHGFYSFAGIKSGLNGVELEFLNHQLNNRQKRK